MREKKESIYITKDRREQLSECCNEKVEVLGGWITCTKCKNTTAFEYSHSEWAEW